jgi:hypothetical protein
MRTGKFLVFFIFVLVLVELGVVQHAMAQGRAPVRTRIYEGPKARSYHEQFNPEYRAREGILLKEGPYSQSQKKGLADGVMEQRERGWESQEMTPSDDE